MEAGHDAPQVVQIISNCRLLDAQSREHTYWRRNGLGLAPGWYVTSWPPGAVAGRFREETVFRGPFERREDAQAALARMGSPAVPREAVAAQRADAARGVAARPQID